MAASSSPWPALRKRARTLASEVYAEAIGEVVIAAERILPPLKSGRPSLHGKIANTLIAWIAFAVACIGKMEKLLHGTGGLPVNDIREATLLELQNKAGALSDKRLLPSAYEVWVGARTEGHLRLRYAYDTNRLATMLPQARDSLSKSATDVCRPVELDQETRDWVRHHVEAPAPGTQLSVWRALKRRLYHYDAGVVAFYGFPRNYLLSTAQWGELLTGHARGSRGVALDVGAGDGSLNEPVRSLFSKIVATELTVPLVCRLRASGLDAVIAEELLAEHLGRSEFDMIFILNVLDRCKDPFSMLEQAHALLPPDGWLVVSVVLPAFQADAADGVGGEQRTWRVVGQDFETATASLVRDVMLPSNFEPLRIVRAPYFCAGDRYSPVAALDACVMVLRRLPPPSSTSAAGTEVAAEVCKPCSVGG